jgi:hypothetical protein
MMQHTTSRNEHRYRVADEGWPVVALKKRAKELGVSGYSCLSKDKLIDKLRSR